MQKKVKTQKEEKTSSKSSRRPQASQKKQDKAKTARQVQAEIVDTEPDHDQDRDRVIEVPIDSVERIESLDENFIADDEIAEPQAFRESQASSPHLPAAAPSREISGRDPLSLYLQEIRKYPLLTREEEMELAKKYFEHKDSAIAQKLVQSNLRFVVKVAAEYSKFGSKMIDLIQEGNVGLMHAVKEFNPYKGARLITYAVWWIRGYIQEYLMRQYSMVRIGTTQNQRKLFYQLQKHKEILNSATSSEQIRNLSQELDIPEEEIQIMAQRLFLRDTSLDRKVDDDSNSGSVIDLQRNTTDEPLDETLARLEQLELLKEKINDIRPDLSEKELILLDERILNDQPLTLQEIGHKYGITREAVRQTEARLIKKIQQKMLGHGEKPEEKSGDNSED